MSKHLITFDMDTNCLKINYHGNNFNNAYSDIRRVLKNHGFDNIQGSVYLGQEGISEAHGTIAIQELTFKFDWFKTCVSNIRFYRLESDLDAQFIVDSAYNVKQKIQRRLENLRANLVSSGLTEQQINLIIEKEKLSLISSQDE